MKKNDMLLWIEALDDCLDAQEARLGAYEKRLAVVEANQNYLARDYSAAVEFHKLSQAVVAQNKPEVNKGGRYLTAEQVKRLKNLRDRLHEIDAFNLITLEVVEVLDEILK